MAKSLAVRIGTIVLALVAGVIFGAVGTIAHSFVLTAGPVKLPLGLLLALIGSGALLIGIRAIADRWAALAAGLGMFGIVMVFSGVGPGGSILVPDTWMGVVWTFATPLMTAVVVAWPVLRARRPLSRAN